MLYLAPLVMHPTRASDGVQPLWQQSPSHTKERQVPRYKLIRSGAENGIQSSGRDMIWREFIEELHAKEFLDFWIEVLQNQPYEAYRLEFKPFSKSQQGDSVRFAVIDASRSFEGMTANPAAFQKKFQENDGQVAAFSNLGGDATLIAPRAMPDVRSQVYVSLASFVRKAPLDQVEVLFQEVGAQLDLHISKSSAPVFLSTAGLGVPWLHVRLDSVPKYYNYQPYKIPGVAASSHSADELNWQRIMIGASIISCGVLLVLLVLCGSSSQAFLHMVRRKIPFVVWHVGAQAGRVKVACIFLFLTITILCQLQDYNP